MGPGTLENNSRGRGLVDRSVENLTQLHAHTHTHTEHRVGPGYADAQVRTIFTRLLLPGEREKDDSSTPLYTTAHHCLLVRVWKSH